MQTGFWSFVGLGRPEMRYSDKFWLTHEPTFSYTGWGWLVKGLFILRVHSCHSAVLHTPLSMQPQAAQNQGRRNALPRIQVPTI